MIAARFPGDRIANNNAAIVAWETGDYDAMRVYLKRLEETGRKEGADKLRERYAKQLK